MKQSYVQDPITHKLVPKDEFYARSKVSTPHIIGSIDPFISPVDGSVIDDHGKLRDHNKKHGVTSLQDYPPGYFERKAKERDEYVTGRSPKAKQERINAIQEAIYKSEHNK